MTDRPAETTPAAVRRHLRNGYIILTERGLVALFGAAMREVAKLIDSPVGAFLALGNIRSDGPALLRSQGPRATIGAVFRQLAAQYDPPLGRTGGPTLANSARFHFTYDLVKPDGVAPARRPVNDLDFALETPFAYACHPQTTGPVAAVVHAYYPDEVESILERLAHIPTRVDLFLSTDTDEKADVLRSKTMGWPGELDIRVLPNRGRDIAAKLIGFKDVYARYEIFIHLHTKKSPHGGEPLARWREYLLDTLIGSPAIASSNLSLFDDAKIGIVYAQHLFEIRGILNWGYDYDMARGLMRRIGFDIDKNLVLEFPSGSMFWGRSAAIAGLLDLGLVYEDFPPEAGQVDGTLAHAIERIVLMAAETRGFEWMKVARRDLYPMPSTIEAVAEPADILRGRSKVYRPCLVSVDDETQLFSRPIIETRPLSAFPSRNERPRLNLLVPTVNPHQVFGGVATALKLFEQWSERLGAQYDRRIVVTDASIEPAGYSALAEYVRVPFVAGPDQEQRALVDAFDRTGGRLDIRARDLFVATAWWTAEFARSFEKSRSLWFGHRRPFVYLIQDDEAYFYGWSSKFARAAATLNDNSDAIAIINSEELYAYLTSKYIFSNKAYCLPYALNETIARSLSPQPREPIVIVYGRPSVVRNAFELICEGLMLWQQRDPIRASRWSIVFLGEKFDETLLYPLQNACVPGKVTLDLYANYLNRASLGISLMLSPHPSYPPLEMAQAGLQVITNSFEGKDLARRFPNILSLETVAPESLAQAIETLVTTLEPKLGALNSVVSPAPLRLPGPPADPVEIAEQIRAALVEDRYFNREQSLQNDLVPTRR